MNFQRIKDKNKAKEFLSKYKELCLQYDLEIIGCGDCGSAWLSELDEENKEFKTLTFTEDFELIQFARNYEMNDNDLIKL